jgi:AraC family transcriptional regulator, regulatory protein of adaptative response / methylated-DNA-[protein]-cysteine methyltransferase
MHTASPDRSTMQTAKRARQIEDDLPTERDPRWARVVARDRSAEGEFFISVATTGVYCRPGCPARMPNPKNVRFHLTTADAEAAGFRPCKRCKPDQPPLAQQYAATIAAACRAIENAEEAPTLAQLAKAAGLSTFHFHRVFKAVTGVTPKDYATAQRSKRLRDQLSNGDSVTEAIYGAGYNSNSRFYEQSDAVLGMTPTEFRDGGANADIKFAIGECSLGSILVASTDKGVCAILIDDDPQVLVRELQDRFPRANLIGGDARFESTVAKVVGFVDAPHLGLNLPLDMRGTVFQQRVWNALREIPAGKTVTYTDIAQRIGAPKSVRAVAGACAANHIAVAIPCHRVVRTDGSLSGYYWGVERKRALLDKERAA